MRLIVAFLLISIVGLCHSLKKTYDACSSDSECRSGRCAFMGSDYGDGNPESKINYYACVKKGKKNIGYDLGKSCKHEENCASRGCGCTMLSCSCVATNYGFNGDACTSNSDCLSNSCYFDVNAKAGQPQSYCLAPFDYRFENLI